MRIVSTGSLFVNRLYLSCKALCVLVCILAVVVNVSGVSVRYFGNSTSEEHRLVYGWPIEFFACSKRFKYKEGKMLNVGTVGMPAEFEVCFWNSDMGISRITKFALGAFACNLLWWISVVFLISSTVQVKGNCDNKNVRFRFSVKTMLCIQLLIAIAAWRVMRFTDW